MQAQPTLTVSTAVHLTVSFFVALPLPLTVLVRAALTIPLTVPLLVHLAVALTIFLFLSPFLLWRSCTPEHTAPLVAAAVACPCQGCSGRPIWRTEQQHRRRHGEPAAAAPRYISASAFAVPRPAIVSRKTDSRPSQWYWYWPALAPAAIARLCRRFCARSGFCAQFRTRFRSIWVCISTAAIADACICGRRQQCGV